MMKNFDITIDYNQITFNYCKKSSIEEREMHTYHEILYYIDGDAVFVTEEYQHLLKSGTLIIIPKGSYHCFKLQNPEKFLRLKISFPHSFIENTPLLSVVSSVKAFENLSDTTLFFLNKLMHTLLEKPSEKVKFSVYSSFLMLLSEIDKTEISNNGNIKKSREGEEVLKIIKYISENLSNDLSIETLSKEIGMSASTITHTFKKEIGISVHKYITERRLFYARELIYENNSPSKIYEECGWHDYSSFYKSYVNFFGYPPSKEKQNT